MSRPDQPDPTERSATYGEVFAVAEFRWLWTALVGSVIGDQLARVALAVLVFDRTGSAGLSALTYALTLLPDIISGPLLGGLADRFPRRRIMVSCDAARAGPGRRDGDPWRALWILCVLLVAGQLLAAPFQSARTTFMATMLTGDTYRAAVGLSAVTGQAAQLAGFVAGGTIVARSPGSTSRQVTGSDSAHSSPERQCTSRPASRSSGCGGPPPRAQRM